MNGTHAGREHLEDAVLLRLLDDGHTRTTLDSAADVSVTAADIGATWPEARHLRSCGECGARAEALARRSGAVSRALHEVDRDVPAPRWNAEFLARIGVEEQRASSRTASPALRWAAAIAVLLAVGSVEPVRAWIGEQAASVWGALTGDEGSGPTDSEGSDPAGSAPGATTEVGVALEGSELRLELPGAGPDRVVFESTESVGTDRVTARLVDRNGEGEIVAMAAGFRVSTSGGHLLVRLPAFVRTIVVVRDGVEQRVEAQRGAPWGLDPE